MIDLTYAAITARISRRRRIIALAQFSAGLVAGFLAGVGLVLLVLR